MSDDKEALFSAKNKKNFSDPLLDSNPIAVQILGVCSALAVTSQLVPSIIMAVSVTFVVAASNVVISIIRKQIPDKIRMIVELLIIATLVILVDEILKAYSFEMSKKLSVFVGLIITNCIVMGRAEAFALHNKPWPSLLDGLGNGLGYGIILIIVGVIREIFGQGSLLGTQIIPESIYKLGYTNNGLMVLPPAAFIILGFIVWGQRQYTKNFEDH